MPADIGSAGFIIRQRFLLIREQDVRLCPKVLSTSNTPQLAHAGSNATFTFTAYNVKASCSNICWLSLFLLIFCCVDEVLEYHLGISAVLSNNHKFWFATENASGYDEVSFQGHPWICLLQSGKISIRRQSGVIHRQLQLQCEYFISAHIFWLVANFYWNCFSCCSLVSFSNKFTKHFTYFVYFS